MFPPSQRKSSLPGVMVCGYTPVPRLAPLSSLLVSFLLHASNPHVLPKRSVALLYNLSSPLPSNEQDSVTWRERQRRDLRLDAGCSWFSALQHKSLPLPVHCISWQDGKPSLTKTMTPLKCFFLSLDILHACFHSNIHEVSNGVYQGPNTVPGTRDPEENQ